MRAILFAVVVMGAACGAPMPSEPVETPEETPVVSDCRVEAVYVCKRARMNCGLQDIKNPCTGEVEPFFCGECPGFYVCGAEGMCETPR